VAVSPNTAEGLSFEQAAEASESSNQKAFRKIIQEMLRAQGLKGQTYDAIGDWRDGAENSLLQEITDATDPATVEYLAAWYGLLANQKSVLVFHPDHSGKDSFYTLSVPATDMQALRQVLDEYDIPFRTIVRRGKNLEVAIYDQNRELRSRVAQFAGAAHARIQESVGTGHFLGDPAGTSTGGSPSRAKARSEYRKVIEQYEARRDTSSAAPTGGVQTGQAPGGDRRQLSKSPRRTFQGLRAPAPLRLGRLKIPAGTFLSRSWFESHLHRRSQGPRRVRL
jgi:hypothetical protein